MTGEFCAAGSANSGCRVMRRKKSVFIILSLMICIYLHCIDLYVVSLVIN